MPPGRQRPADALQQRERLRLVVHGVEGRHVVEGLGVGVAVEGAQVALLEADVLEAARRPPRRDA